MDRMGTDLSFVTEDPESAWEMRGLIAPHLR